MKKLKLASRNLQSGPHASVEYRQNIPFTWAERHGLISWKGTKAFPTDKATDLWRLERAVLQRQDVIHSVSSVSLGQEVLWTEAAPKGYAYFHDADDNFHYVNPLNPAFSTAGTTNLQGELMEPGDSLFLPFPDGTTKEVWKDGEQGFDIKRNLKLREMIDTSMRCATGVTVSTPTLGEYYTKALTLDNVYVYPNSIDFEIFPFREMASDPGRIRVLWAGGMSHFADFFEIRNALKRCAKKFPEVTFVFFGARYDGIYSAVPPEQMEFIEWVPVQIYYDKLATLDFDFMLAPLVTNIFNDSKSCIKFYESAMFERPLLAKDTKPYNTEIVDGDTGFLYKDDKDFELKFEQLVRDSKLRRTVGKRAKEWVKANRDCAVTVPPYIDWMREQVPKHGRYWNSIPDDRSTYTS